MCYHRRIGNDDFVSKETHSSTLFVCLQENSCSHSSWVDQTGDNLNKKWPRKKFQNLKSNSVYPTVAFRYLLFDLTNGKKRFDRSSKVSNHQQCIKRLCSIFIWKAKGYLQQYFTLKLLRWCPEAWFRRFLQLKGCFTSAATIICHVSIL